MTIIRHFSLKKITDLVLFLFQLILGLIFILASIDKIINPSKFLEIINNYNVIPVFITPIIAVVLPWIEFISGSFLILGILTESAVLMIVFLLIMFISGVSLNLYRGADIECGCFSLLFNNEQIGVHTILRDVIFMLLAIIILIFNRNICIVEKLFPKKFSNKNSIEILNEDDYF